MNNKKQKLICVADSNNGDTELKGLLSLGWTIVSISGASSPAGTNYCWVLLEKDN